MTAFMYHEPPKWAVEGTVAWEWRERTIQAAGRAKTGPVIGSYDVGVPDTKDHPTLRMEAAALVIDRSVHGWMTETAHYEVVNKRMTATSAQRREREIRVSQDIAPKIHTDVYQFLAYYHPKAFEESEVKGSPPSARLLRVMAVPLVGQGTPIDTGTVESSYVIPDLGQPGWLTERWNVVIGYHRQYGIMVRKEHARLLMRVFSGMTKEEATKQVAFTPLAEIERALYLTHAAKITEARNTARAQILLAVTSQYPHGRPV